MSCQLKAKILSKSLYLKEMPLDGTSFSCKPLHLKGKRDIRDIFACPFTMCSYS